MNNSTPATPTRILKRCDTMLINETLFDELTVKAKESPRLRMNFNLHDSLDAKAQRLFNALEPGTVMPVHRHMASSETQVLMRGSMKVMFYDDKGQITEEYMLDNSTGNYGVQIPAGVWHSLEVLQTGTIILEIKDGPYRPLQENDILMLNPHTDNGI